MKARLWRFNTIATVLLLVLAVVLPIVVVLQLNAANKPTGRGPVGPDQAGDDWDPHGYVTITAVMFAVPVLAAVALALGRTLAQRKTGLALSLFSTVLAGLYLLTFGHHLPIWLAVLAAALTIGTAALAIAGLAAAQPEPGRLAEPPWPKV